MGPCTIKRLCAPAYIYVRHAHTAAPPQDVGPSRNEACEGGAGTVSEEVVMRTPTQNSDVGVKEICVTIFSFCLIKSSCIT